MRTETCASCERPVTAAGSAANLWTFGDRDGSEATGMTLEFVDGSTHLLCYPCIAALPDEPTAEELDDIEPIEEDAVPRCTGCDRAVDSVDTEAERETTNDEATDDTTPAATLTLADGSPCLLCYPCLAVLPDEPTVEDVESLERVDEETSRLVRT